MKITTGIVVEGKVVIEGESLAEGSTVTVVLRDNEEAFELTPGEAHQSRSTTSRLKRWPNPPEALDALRLERLDLLKLHSTAGTARVLDGASDTLWRLRPMLFAAVEDGMETRALAARMSNFGYRCWAVHTRLFNRGNHNCRESDIFDGEIACALLSIPEESNVSLHRSECVEIVNQ